MGESPRCVRSRDNERVADDRELIRNDPDSEAALPQLVEVISEALYARILVRDRSFETREDADHLAVLAADEVLMNFHIRPRERNEPRYSWADRSTNR